MTTDEGMQTTKLQNIKITADAVSAVLELDGEDISRAVRGYTLQQLTGQPPMVVLQLGHPVEGTQFEGLARVTIGEPVIDAATFLAGIDPAALEAAAFERELDGQPGELTRAMLAQLLEWAQGAQ